MNVADVLGGPNSDVRVHAADLLRHVAGDVDVAVEVVRIVAGEVDAVPCQRPLYVAPGVTGFVANGIGVPCRPGQRLTGIMERRAERMVKAGEATFKAPRREAA